MRTLALISLLCGMMAVGAVACGDGDEEGSSNASGGQGTGKGGSGGKGAGDAGADSGGNDGTGDGGSDGAEGGAGPGAGGANGSAGNDAGGANGDAGGSAGGNGPGACNDVVAEGDLIPETAAQGTLPTPQGGTFEEGSYELIGWEVYPPEEPGSSMRQLTFVVDGNEVQVFSGHNNQRFNAEFSTEGSTMTLTPICPAEGDPDMFGYTVQGDEFWIIREEESRVEIFQKID